MESALVTVAKALSDSHRVRILMALTQGELCVCQVVEMLGLAPSTVSKHIALLAQAGLLLTRKEGRWIHCRLPGRDAPPVVRDALRWIQTHLPDDPRVAKDCAALCKITSVPPEVISRRQARRLACCE